MLHDRAVEKICILALKHNPERVDSGIINDQWDDANATLVLEGPVGCNVLNRF